MTEQKDYATGIRRQKKWPYPLIWLIPFLSAVCAGLYLRDYLLNHGPNLVIDFQDASGLRVGEAKVLYRGAEVGAVKSIRLSENHKRALVEVQFDQSDSAFATQGASFWIVRPEVSEAGLSGLGTLFSGPYIEAIPGQAEQTVATIEGLVRPPRPYQEGHLYNLAARRIGHVQEGSSVLYKGIQVGTVEKVGLSSEADHLNIQIIVWTRYSHLVRENSKFWFSSGIDFEGGIFSGVHLKLDSLKTLTSGAIAFATPEKDLQAPAKSGSNFTIDEDPKREWELWAPKISISPRAEAPTSPKRLPIPKSEKK